MAEFIRLLRLFAPKAGWLALGLLFMLATLVTQLLTLNLAGTLLAYTGLASGLWLFKVSGAARPLLRYAERLLTHSATFRVLARLRLWLFARLVPLAPHTLGTRRSGDVLGRLLQDVDALDGFVLRLLLPAAIGTLALVAIFVLLCFTGAWHMVQAALGVLAIAAGLILHTLNRLQTTVRALPDLQAEVRSHVLDGCEGLSDLLASDAADDQLHKITLASAALARAQLVQVRLRLATQVFVGLASGALLLLAILAIDTLTVQPFGGASAFGLVLSVLVALETLPPLGQALTQWPLLHSAAIRVFALADTPAQITEPSSPVPLPGSSTIELKNVTVKYGRNQPALRNITLSLATNERLLITGPSGAGKTTLLQLLLKFIMPTQGQLLAGGVDLADLHGDDWRTRIATLSQSTALLAGSVRENLLLANPAADDAALWQALEAANLASFIRELPEGLETWVGEGGASLSGGQARRLALAQLFLKEAPVWLLDEPTEGLDAATAGAVLQSIAAQAAGKALVLITHQSELGQLIAPTRQLTLRQGILTAA